MASYGRNFEVVATPEANGRINGYTPTTGSPLPMGIPVEVDTAAAVNALRIQGIKVSASDTAKAQGSGQGVLLYEYAPAAFAGTDPEVTLYSDLDTVPVGSAAQVIHGPGDGIMIILRNTTTATFLNTRSYTGRTMVAGLGGATPTIAVGDYLLPGTGNDTSGWWKETATAANGWLRVVSVDNTRAECVCELLV